MISMIRICQVLLFVSLFLLTNRHCFAADPAPTAEELKKAHRQLQEDSESVQGKFRVYRVEKVLPDIFEMGPSQLALDLKSEGYLWRSKDRFRADYRTFRMVKGKIEETERSLAKDRKRIYEFSVSPSGIAADTMMIYELKAEEAKGALGHIEATYFHNLDSLWSSSGVSYIDFLREPGSKIILDNLNPAGARLSLLVPTRDKYSIGPELETDSPYPFKHVDIIPAKGMKHERRVEYTEQNGIVVPSRITTVSAFGGGNGYSEVVIFELEPLAENSPIDKDFDESSFKKSGKDCMVNHFKEPEPWIKRQYNSLRGNLTRLKGSLGGGNTYLLWLGATAVLLLLVWFVFFRKSGQALK